MAIREGAWDCLHCGMKRNRGPEKFCGGCGAPRGDNVKFYLPEDARVVEDEEELRRAKAGPDWNCRYCGGDNQGYNNFCTGCGAGKDGSAPRKTTEYKIDEIPEMVRGKGVILQRYKNGGLSDIKLFTLAEGLSWKMGEKTRLETRLLPWLGKRGQGGKLPPTGFPRTNRF